VACAAPDYLSINTNLWRIWLQQGLQYSYSKRSFTYGQLYHKRGGRKLYAILFQTTSRLRRVFRRRRQITVLSSLTLDIYGYCGGLLGTDLLGNSITVEVNTSLSENNIAASSLVIHRQLHHSTSLTVIYSFFFFFFFNFFYISS
jgi:hypothetical protein